MVDESQFADPLNPLHNRLSRMQGANNRFSWFVNAFHDRVREVAIIDFQKNGPQ
jgi:hypothetical protein